MRGLTRGAILAVAAVAAGSAGAYFADNYVDSRIAEAKAAIDAKYETVKVVVANHDLAAGTPLTTTDVAARAIPRTYLHADAVRATQWSAISGRTISVPINAGEPILSTHLSLQVGAGFSSRLPDGMRALTIPVDDQSSISGMLSPDDHIDLMVTLSDSSDSYTFPLLRDIRVIATGAVTRNRGNDAGNRYRNATIAVSPRDAARVTHAMNVGSVTAVLRSAGDRERGADYRIDKDLLLGRSGHDSPIAPVEVIVGGQL